MIYVDELIKEKREAKLKNMALLEQLSSDNITENMLNFAKFNVCYFMNMVDINKPLESILNELSINNSVFSRCVQIVKDFEPDLYKKYLIIRRETNKKAKENNIEMIKDLLQGLNTGIFSDGKEFSDIEFLKRFPYKGYNDPIKQVDNLSKSKDLTEDIKDVTMINNYLIKKNFMPIKREGYKDNELLLQELDSTAVIKGYEITDEDNRIVLNFINKHQIPMTRNIFIYLRREYVNYQLQDKDNVR